MEMQRVKVKAGVEENKINEDKGEWKYEKVEMIGRSGVEGKEWK